MSETPASPSNKRRNRGDAALDEILASTPKGHGANQWPCFIGTAAVLALLPFYLYSSVYHVDVKANWYIYGIVVPVTIACLAVAYHNVYKVRRAKLFGGRSRAYKRSGQTRDDFEHSQQSIVNKESLSYALWFNNLVFCLVFSFLAFYALKNLEPHYNYLFASLVASVLQWQLSTTA